jgi:ABC-type sulfate transport system substrate-binding protein
MKLQSDNKFELILEIAEEANDFLLNNPDESIVKRPVLKVISDRVNESGTRDVADAYLDATFEFLEDLGRFNLH